MEPIALSTCWNAGRHQEPEGLLREARDLGFRRVEVYNHFSEPQLRGLLRRAPDLGVEVASFHAPCPVAPDWQRRSVQTGDHLASPAERTRLEAVDAFRETVDWAGRHGARAVVLHLGHVDVPYRQGEVLRSARERGRTAEGHRRLVDATWREREAAKGPHLAAALRSIRALGEHAAGAGVRLGVECRDGYHEIPSLEEVAELLGVCEGLPVWYWHDAGHAARLEYLGFLDQEEYLRRYGHRLLGMHLHDHDQGVDHLPPGQGRTDFDMLFGYLRADTLRTLEMGPRTTAAEIVEGMRRIGGRGGMGGSR